MASPRSRIQNLRLRIPTLDSNRVHTVQPTTQRLRGRAAVERRARWLAEHPLCVDCQAEGRTGIADEVDHEVPLWKGGADDESNFASRCKHHHALKTAREATQRAGGAIGKV